MFPDLLSRGQLERRLALRIADVAVSAGQREVRHAHREPSLAVNPENPDEIVISVLGFPWHIGSAPLHIALGHQLFHSTDGGQTWSVHAAVPPPAGVSGVEAGPYNQTIEYGRRGILYGAFLNHPPYNIFVGSTDDPTKASHWKWEGGATPLAANRMAAGAEPDQPWLVVNADPEHASRDNVYIGYTALGTNDVRVAAMHGGSPPELFADMEVSAVGGFGINPGMRLAVDHGTGFVYSLFQKASRPSSNSPVRIQYILNRSTDGGRSWSLDGQAGGISVDPDPQATQMEQFKFGEVNALLGGTDHLAVEQRTGNVYVVYGGDPEVNAGSARLFLRRIEGMRPGASAAIVPDAVRHVTAGRKNALPGVAVTADGTVGVLYYTFEEFDEHGLPIFTVHFSRSYNGGQTYYDHILSRFTSPFPPALADPRQRVFGDYVQLKAVENRFYGVFIGNGADYGRSFPTSDPIFFSSASVEVSVVTVARAVSQIDQPHDALPSQWGKFKRPIPCDRLGAAKPPKSVKIAKGVKSAKSVKVSKRVKNVKGGKTVKGARRVKPK